MFSWQTIVAMATAVEIMLEWAGWTGWIILLAKIVDSLFDNNILSPSGKSRWTRPMINKVLSNKKYVPHIIGFEQYIAVQFEKQARSNIDHDSDRRMACRHTSPML